MHTSARAPGSLGHRAARRNTLHRVTRVPHTREPKSRRDRLLFASSITVIMAALFWIMHTGARANSVCGDAGLQAVPDRSAPSLWPPGVRCIGGSEQADIVRFDPTFLILLPTVFLLACAAALVLGAIRTRRSSDRAAPDNPSRMRSPRASAAEASRPQRDNSGRLQSRGMADPHPATALRAKRHSGLDDCGGGSEGSPSVAALTATRPAGLAVPARTHGVFYEQSAASRCVLSRYCHECGRTGGPTQLCAPRLETVNSSAAPWRSPRSAACRYEIGWIRSPRSRPAPGVSGRAWSLRGSPRARGCRRGRCSWSPSPRVPGRRRRSAGRARRRSTRRAAG
jgi:hypothetical protein